MENGTSSTGTPDRILNGCAKKASAIYCAAESRNEMKFCESNPYHLKSSDSDGSSEAEEKARVVTFFSSFLKRTRAFGSRKRPRSLIVFRETSKQKSRLSFLDRLRSLKKFKSLDLFRLQFTRNLKRKTSKIWTRDKRCMANGASTCKQALDEGTFRHTYSGDLHDFDSAGDSNLISNALESISIEDKQQVNKNWKSIQQYFKSSNRKTFDPNCYGAVTVFPEDAGNKYAKITGHECKKSGRNDVLNYLKKMSIRKKLDLGVTEKNIDRKEQNADGLVDSESIKQECDQSCLDKSSRIRDRKRLKGINFSKVIKVISRERKQSNFTDTYTQFEETPQRGPSYYNHGLHTTPVIPETTTRKVTSPSQSSLTSDSGTCNPLSQSITTETPRLQEVTRADISARRCNSELLDSFTSISLCDEWKSPEVVTNCRITTDGGRWNEAAEVRIVSVEPKVEMQPKDVSEHAR